VPFFADSLELEGANWCDDMPAEFQKRRGYDLPTMAAISFIQGNSNGQHVRI
jgi:hypothetical protein